MPVSDHDRKGARTTKHPIVYFCHYVVSRSCSCLSRRRVGLSIILLSSTNVGIFLILVLGDHHAVDLCVQARRRRPAPCLYNSLLLVVFTTSTMLIIKKCIYFYIYEDPSKSKMGGSLFVGFMRFSRTAVFGRSTSEKFCSIVPVS